MHNIIKFCKNFTEDEIASHNIKLRAPAEIIDKYPKGVYGIKWRIDSCLSCDFLKTHIDGINGEPWNVKELSRCWDLDMNFVKNNINGICGQNWFIPWLSSNNNLTEEFVEEFIDGINGYTWDVGHLLSNKNISFDFIVRHPNGLSGKKWNPVRDGHPNHFYLENEYTKYRDFFHQNPEWIEFLVNSMDISLDFIEDHINGINGVKWNMESLSCNENINMEFVERYINGINGEKWDLVELSANKSITQVFLEKYPNGFCNQKWYMRYLSENPVINDNFVEKYIFGFCGSKWNKKHLLENDSISNDFIIKYSNYERACKNNNIIRVAHESGDSDKIKFIQDLTNWTDLDSFGIYRVPDLLENPKLTDKILQEDFLGMINMNALISNTKFSDDILEKYPNGIFGIHWHDWAYSCICPINYIWEHPEGYDDGNKIIPWNLSIITHRDWSTIPSSNTKSSKKIC